MIERLVFFLLSAAVLAPMSLGILDIQTENVLGTSQPDHLERHESISSIQYQKPEMPTSSRIRPAERRQYYYH